MKSTFSKFEKDVINRMSSIDESNGVVCLRNILTDTDGILGTGNDYEFSSSDKEKFSLTCSKEFDMSNESYKETCANIEAKLYDTILLLEFLVEKRYIILIDRDNSLKNEPSYKQSIPLNADLQKRLCNMWNKDIKVLMRLKSLKQHDYLDEELYELKSNNKRSRFLSLAALGVSIVSILASVLVQCVSVQKVSVESFKDSLEITNRFEAQK